MKTFVALVILGLALVCGGCGSTMVNRGFELTGQNESWVVPLHGPKDNSNWVVPRRLKPVMTYLDWNREPVVLRASQIPDRFYRILTYTTQSGQKIEVSQEMTYKFEDHFEINNEWIELPKAERLYTLSSFGSMCKGVFPGNEKNLPVNERVLVWYEVEGKVYALTSHYLWKFEKEEMQMVLELPRRNPENEPGDLDWVDLDQNLLGQPVIVLNNSTLFYGVIFYNISHHDWQLTLWKNNPDEILLRTSVEQVHIVGFNYVLVHYRLPIDQDRFPMATVVEAYGDGKLKDAAPTLISVERDQQP